MTGIYILAIIGGIWSLWQIYRVLHWLVDGFLFATGYAIFISVSLNDGYIRNHLFEFIWKIAKTWFRGFHERLTGFGDTIACRSAVWAWEPYFHFTRREP